MIAIIQLSVIFLIYFSVNSNFVFADQLLSQKELLARCYAHLTGHRLPIKDPLWGKLSTNTASQLCSQLIDSVQLDSSNGRLTNPNDPVQRNILKQFSDIHRDWFPLHNSFVQGALLDFMYGTVDVYDPDEPSLFITRSLFTPGVTYSSVLRGNSALFAIRDSSTAKAPYVSNVYAGTPDPAQTIPPQIFNMSAITGQTANTIPSNFNTYIAVPIIQNVQIGSLIGIGVLSSDTTVNNLWTNIFTANAKLNDPLLINPQKIHQNYGGGALGSTPFILMNFGQDFNYVSNGSLKLPRRVMSVAMNSFMCLNGPFLRTEDITQFLAPTSDKNAAPFRNATACLRCHSTLDQASLTMRNLRLGATANSFPAAGRGPAMVFSHIIDQRSPTTLWSPDSNPLFSRTPPLGRLYFRSSLGHLIDQPLNNLNDLGVALSNSPDFYTCAASRYFKYFTGIGVNLFDPNAPENQQLLSSLNSKDLEYRNYVFNLGKELQKTGSLKSIIKSIINSQYYKLSGYGR